MDPSTIYFEGADTATRLDPTDALLVDIVHTDAPYQNSGVFGSDHIGLGFESSLGIYNLTSLFGQVFLLQIHFICHYQATSISL